MAIVCARYGQAAYGVSRYCADTPVDHIAEAKEQVWNRFKKCPNITKLAAIWGSRFQAMSYELRDIRLIRDIDNAHHSHLDRLGAIVGQPRNGFGDDLYRSLIKARTFIGTSSGTSEDLIRAAVTIRGGDPSNVRFTPLPPAAVLIEFLNTTETLSEQQLIVTIFFLIKLGGVRIAVVFVPVTPFGFAGNPAAFGFNVGTFGTVYVSG